MWQYIRDKNGTHGTVTLGKCHKTGIDSTPLGSNEGDTTSNCRTLKIEWYEWHDLGYKYD